VFSAKAPPAIAIRNYIKRKNDMIVGIFKYLYCSQAVLIVTLIAAIVAAKYTDDKFYSNAHYAKVYILRVLRV
jgi:hypothetical protein